MAVSPNGKQFVTGYEDGTVGLWDVTPSNEDITCHLEAQKGEETVTMPWGLNLVLDSNLIASGLANATILVWNPMSGVQAKGVRACHFLLMEHRWHQD
jgi:WD40 repeat protein